MFTQICFCLPVDFRIIIYAFRQGVSDQKVPNTIHRGLIGPCKLVIVTMSRDQSVTFRDSSVFRYLLLYKYKILCLHRVVVEIYNTNRFLQTKF